MLPHSPSWSKAGEGDMLALRICKGRTHMPVYPVALAGIFTSAPSPSQIEKERE